MLELHTRFLGAAFIGKLGLGGDYSYPYREEGTVCVLHPREASPSSNFWSLSPLSLSWLPFCSLSLIKRAEKAREVQCTNNQHQILLAILGVVQDNQELMPTSDSMWATINVPAESRLCLTNGTKDTLRESTLYGYDYNNYASGRTVVRFLGSC